MRWVFLCMCVSFFSGITTHNVCLILIQTAFSVCCWLSNRLLSRTGYPARERRTMPRARAHVTNFDIALRTALGSSRAFAVHARKHAFFLLIRYSRWSSSCARVSCHANHHHMTAIALCYTYIKHIHTFRNQCGAVARCGTRAPGERNSFVRRRWRRRSRNKHTTRRRHAASTGHRDANDLGCMPGNSCSNALWRVGGGGGVASVRSARASVRVQEI